MNEVNWEPHRPPDDLWASLSCCDQRDELVRYARHLQEAAQKVGGRCLTVGQFYEDLAAEDAPKGVLPAWDLLEMALKELGQLLPERQ